MISTQMPNVISATGVGFGFPSQVSVTMVTTAQSLRPQSTPPGSGITVYQLRWDHLNASIALDGNFSKTYVHDVSCIRQSPRGCYNTTLYDIHSLAYGDHVLEISLQDYLADSSNINIDYVSVNGSRPTATATVESSPKRYVAWSY
jgi:hypothetical protein